MKGNPWPRISWCKMDPYNLAACGHRKVPGSTMRIEMAWKENHEGWYTFFAENLLGKVSESVYLHVHERPAPIRKRVCRSTRCFPGK